MKVILPLIALITGLLPFTTTVDAADDAVARDLISTYCMSCHSSAKHKGDTDLEKLPLFFTHVCPQH